MPEIIGFTVQTAIVAGFVAGAVWVGIWSYRRHSAQSLAGRIRAHFRPLDWAQIKIVDRRFPFHMRADLQKALESILEGFQVSLVSSIAQQHAFAEITFPGIIASGSDYPLSLQFEEVKAAWRWRAGGHWRHDYWGMSSLPSKAGVRPHRQLIWINLFSFD